LPKERHVFYRDWQQHAEVDKRIIFRCNNSLLQIKKAPEYSGTFLVEAPDRISNHFVKDLMVLWDLAAVVK
jgi:hypothetical protein